MKALVVENSADTPIGLVGPLLQDKFGIDLTIVNASTVDFDATNPDDFDLVIILGSPNGVYQKEIPWIRKELEFTKALVDADKPLFGICFGGQMIAAALGANVEPMGERHHGWIENDVAVNDQWSGPWFRWHGDTFELPEGATPLARSGDTVQAFQRGSAVAVQFHPEANAEIVKEWVEQNRQQLTNDGVDIDGFLADMEKQTQAVGPRLTSLIEDVLSRCLGKAA
ncbi:type 1 glutamine amidotransferase [Rhizobium brockwellii]|jgi:GMP synthase-like glutamine amidotransferase|uniref:type 1 glutamine amidotransferase n=1 Tax=Rhizobium TaxID=379 RepID=UPI003F9D44B7